VNFSTCTLREAREHLGKTQQEMADFLGISRNYVTMIEGGDKPFSDKLRRKLLNFCKPLPTVVSEKKEPDYRVNGTEQKSQTEGTCPACAAKDKEIAWLRSTITNLQENFRAALAAVERKNQP
jgi:transcriptional regulator with XRE-family HTH domain